MIPGGLSVAAKALGAVGQTTVAWFACTGRVPQPNGIDVSSYAAPVTLRGSLQAIAHNAYQELGLDLQNRYIWFVTREGLQDVERDMSGDQLQTADGQRWQVLSATDWQAVAGFGKYLCVAVPTP